MIGRTSASWMFFGVLALGLTVPAAAQDSGNLTEAEAAKLYPDKPVYSPYAGRNFPTRPFFGDTHLHTAFSMDAGAFGARLGPRDAYRFARGEEIMASSGQPAKLSRPLDFLVVADHSDNMGFFPDLFAGKPSVLADPTGQELVRHDPVGQGRGGRDRDHRRLLAGTRSRRRSSTVRARTAYKNAWQETIEAAEEYNEPGRFTAFIGYEWTSNTGGNNLHRNVIFRDDGDKASQVEPFTVYPPLWQRQSRAISGSGCRPTRRRPAATCSPSRTTATSQQRPHVPDDRDLHRQAGRRANTPRRARSGNGSTRRRRPRATARRIRSCRRTTSSPTSRSGTRAISTAAWRRRPTCSSSNMRGRR